MYCSLGCIVRFNLTALLFLSMWSASIFRSHILTSMTVYIYICGIYICECMFHIYIYTHICVCVLDYYSNSAPLAPGYFCLRQMPTNGVAGSSVNKVFNALDFFCERLPHNSVKFYSAVSSS